MLRDFKKFRCYLSKKLEHYLRCCFSKFVSFYFSLVKNKVILNKIPTILSAVAVAVYLLPSGVVAMSIAMSDIQTSLVKLADERSTNNSTQIDCKEYFDYLEPGFYASKYDPAFREIGVSPGIIHFNNKNQIYYTLNNAILKKISNKFHNGDYIAIVFITESLSVDSEIKSLSCTLLNSEHL